MRVDLLVIRFGEYLVMEVDDQHHAEAVAEAAYDNFPGPFSPIAIFVDGRFAKEIGGSVTKEKDKEAYAENYASARRVELYE